VTTPPATPAVELPPPDVGIVVIGRNEGERLVRCLASLGSAVHRTVYVDSGSTDGSADHARAVGADVVDLDLSVPFTAARARNQGFQRLLDRQPELQFVQFVDGDCEVEAGWLGTARAALANAGLAAVFGRRRERFRERTVYNLVSDLEWDVPVGEVESCGGDVMMRVAALREVGGYDPSLIAGEEPDLCRRLRERGWRIRCVDAPMTIHDAALDRFGQWWRRAVRAGYVEGEGLARLGRRYPRFRQALSNVFWTLGLPAALFLAELVLGAGWPFWLVCVTAVAGQVAALAVLWWRIGSRSAARWAAQDAAWYAWFCILSKFSGLQGMVVYWWRRCLRKSLQIIEYKDPLPAAALRPARAAAAELERAVAVVVIGRNEGERLAKCLRSLVGVSRQVVYVDSGSRDGSVELAARAGVEVVALDSSMPFTAARARNAGVERLVQLWPAAEFVQFVDGDCELEPDWLAIGLHHLRQSTREAVVFGRCREQYRDASVYNLLCDLEWDVPLGPAQECGGNTMTRLLAFREVGGFDAALIAGEEPDLCWRLLRAGWHVTAVPAPMVRHDAALRSFGQWWRRSVRAGYVGAEGLARRGWGYLRARHSLGNVLWSTLPVWAGLGAVAAWLLGATMAQVLPALAAGLLLAYALFWLHVLRKGLRKWSLRDSVWYATFCMVGKWPALQGMLIFWWRSWRGRRGTLIEYKDPPPPTSAAN
jgi:GT2 family glycosyltransferase